MTKDQLISKVAEMGLSNDYTSLVNATKAKCERESKPFQLPTRSELTIIDENDFPLNQVHKGVELGYSRLLPTKEGSKNTHYPQTAIDFGNKGVKMLLGSHTAAGTPVFYETVEAKVIDTDLSTNETKVFKPLIIQGKQVYNLVQCSENKYSSAQTVEAPKAKAKAGKK